MEQVQYTNEPLEILELEKVEIVPDDEEALYVWVNGGLQLIVRCDSGTGLKYGVVCAGPEDVAPTGIWIPEALYGREGERYESEGILEPRFLLMARRKYSSNYGVDRGSPMDVVKMKISDVLLELMSGINGWPAPWWLDSKYCPIAHSQAMNLIQQGL